jgi:hypothetical protein
MIRTLLIWLLLSSTAAAQSINMGPGMVMPPLAGKFVYIDQIGDNNVTYVKQVDSGNQQAVIVSHGDNNNVTVLQHDAGDHRATVGPDGAAAANSVNSSNDITILQTGDGNHRASVVLSDPVSNSNNTASINQSGGVGADKSFTLQLSGSNIGATVIQDNPTTPDSASMSISCYTGSCKGYSYVKH